jgi:hypothetical protein
VAPAKYTALAQAVAPVTGWNVVAGSATGTGITGLWQDYGVEPFAGRDPASGLPIWIIRYQEENVCRQKYREKE